VRDADVLIVGAGAAGLATAIFARRAGTRQRVVVLDGAKRPGAKILISGGSRCNVTNAVVTDRDYWGGRSTIVRRVLRAFPAHDAIAFFRELGVPLHEEPGGKLFPDSNRSRDVLDALLRELHARGGFLQPDERVLALAKRNGEFLVTTSREEWSAATVVLATGGLSVPKTGSDGAGFAMARSLGHTVVPTTPALAPLLLDPQSFHRDVSGVAHDVELAVWVDGAVATRLRGAMLWTHFGVSGPVAMNASRHWLRAQIEGKPVAITVNFAPDRGFDTMDAEIVGAARNSPASTVGSLAGSVVPASVAAALLTAIGIPAATTLAHLTRDDRRRLTRTLVEWPLPVTGTRGYGFAEATAGGVALDEIDPRTMESRRCAGLFLVGEVLDVDGRIGGFNFQWAWSTGFVAGRAIAAAPPAGTGPATGRLQEGDRA
jgi:predicted Rossmann fold flavoprotein